MTLAVPVHLLARVDPERARERIRGTLRATGGRRLQAAQALGVARVTLYRLLSSLALWGDVDAIAAEFDHYRKGPPRGMSQRENRRQKAQRLPAVAK